MKLNIPQLYKNLVLYELKIICRNRRPREMIFGFIICYLAVISLYFIKGGQELLYNYIIISSVYFLYSPLIFAWESKYYDSIYSKNIEIKDMIAGKILFLRLINIGCLIVFIPFLLLDPVQIIQLSLLTVFNIGIYPYTDIFLASFNKRKVRLYKGRTFNLEGYAFISAVNAYKTIIIGMLIYLFIEIAQGKYKILIPGILAVAGLINLLLSYMGVPLGIRWIRS